MISQKYSYADGHPISTGDLISCSLLSHRLFFPTPLCPVSCHPIYVSGNIILSETKQKTLQFDDTHIRIHSKPKINGIYRNMLRVCYVMLYILYIPIVRCTYIGYICGGDRIPSASSTLIIIYASHELRYFILFHFFLSARLPFPNPLPSSDENYVWIFILFCFRCALYYTWCFIRWCLKSETLQRIPQESFKFRRDHISLISSL